MPKGKKNPAGPQGGANGRTAGGRINKMECMRQALVTLGNDARPLEILGHLKKAFGLTMSTKMISTYKGNILKNQARRSAPMRSPVVMAVAPAPARRAGGIDDARAVKELADRIGPEEVRDWLDVLYR